MSEMYEAGRRNGKTVESIAEVVRKAVGEGIDAGLIKAPMLTPMYVGMDSVINPIYKVEADGFATGGLIPKPKPEVHFWEDCKIQRNGKYTTVIWKDGTVTRVTCQGSDEPDDLRAFEEALAKKLYGSRTALKKFVEKNTTDMIREKAHKKHVKRCKGDERRRAEGELIARDTYNALLSVGDTVYVERSKTLDAEGRICSDDLEGGIYRIEELANFEVRISRRGTIISSACLIKVRTEPPYSVGDYVVFRNPKENYLVHSEAWTSHMTAEKPLRIEKINGTNLLCSDGCVYESLWIRGAEKTEEDTEE